MKIDILTLFPEVCRAPLSESMMKRAQESGAFELHIHNLRDWTTDKHHIVDDAPFGGGQGMVMKPEPIFAAVESLRSEDSFVVLMTPQGRRLTQAIASEFSARPHLIIICGHYEGVDHRVIEHLVDAEISIGDYVLTNGAIAAVVLADAVVRLLPGVLGHEQSAADDSFQWRFIGRSALHSTGGIPRVEGSRCVAVRKSCGDRRVAEGAGAAKNA